MAFGLRQLFNQQPAVAPVPPRPRLAIADWPAAVYAIGDVHGCLGQLQLLHDKIYADAAAIAGDKLIVMLGDYVDRGPNTAGVLEFLQAPLPAGFRRICLIGNHEVMMLEHIANPRLNPGWFDLGGVETLLSYGIESGQYLAASGRDRAGLLQGHIPFRHLEFLEGLPLLLSLPGVLFVHAGVRPGIPLDQQDEADLLWIRNDPADDGRSSGPVIVHGHTPAAMPVALPNRICVDTGAFATGTLTAVRLQLGQPPKFLNVGAAQRQL